MSKLIKLLILLIITVKSFYWNVHVVVPIALVVACAIYVTELLQDILLSDEEVL